MDSLHKIKVSSENEYVIEVNDKGDTISFDVSDPELMLKIDDTMHKLNKLKSMQKQEELIIKKQEDKETNGILSVNERKNIESIIKMCNDMRKVLDGVLGEGACQKIFGNKNWYTMFDELFEQLEPHFANMGLNASLYAKGIEAKYGDKEKDVI